MRFSPIERPALTPSHSLQSRIPFVWILLGGACLLLPIETRSGECIDYDDFLHFVGSVEGIPVTYVATSGDRACTTSGATLSVMDLSDPASPVVVGSITIPGHHFGRLVAVGNHVYVAASAHGLAVFDISNPSSPALVGMVDTPNNAIDVAVVGNYAYVIDGFLRVINVSNPASPTIVATANVPGIESVAAAGNYVYAASNSLNLLRVVNVSNPSSPVIVGSVVVDLANDVTVDGSLVYLSGDYDAALQIVDVSNPASPAVVGTVPTEEFALGIEVAGGYAFLPTGLDPGWGLTRGLIVVDVSNANSPAVVGRLTLPWYGTSLALGGDFAYVVTGGQLQVVSIANPESAPGAEVDTPGQAQGVALADNHAFVADLFGLTIVDVSDPKSPTLVGGIGTNGTATDVAILNDYALIADGISNELVVVDISIPSNPFVVTSIGTTDNALAVVVVGNHAFVAIGNSGLLIVDVSNPASPAIVGSVNTPGRAQNVAVAGSYAYVADRAAGLQIVNIENPGAPAIIGAVDTPGSAYDVVVAGDRAYVADEFNVQVVDIANPAAPTLESVFETPSAPLGVFLRGPHLYVADYDGVQVVDVSNPSSLEIIGGFDTIGAASTVTVLDNFAYVGDGPGGLLIVPAQCDITTAVEPSGGQAPGAGLRNLLAQNRPNPFHPGHGLTQIQFDVAVVTRASLRLFDAAGRRVRLLLDETISPGSHRVTWDGRNDGGQEVAAGIYFYRLDAGEFSATRRLVKLR